MVKVAIAGGTADVAKEVIDVLVAAKKHDVLLLSRRDAPKDEARTGVRWAKTDYQDVDSLTGILYGVETVLSFVDAMSDPDNIAQRTLIDASIRAGVKRFAPSEWAVSNIDDLPWYKSKAAVRAYLADINKDRKVLEYTLFCPGIFTNYYTYPYPSAKHLNIFELNIDFHKRRALLPDRRHVAHGKLATVDSAHSRPFAFIFNCAADDLSHVLNSSQADSVIVPIFEKKIRGKFDITRLRAENLRQEPPVINSSWLPTVGHHSAPTEVWQGFVPRLIAGMLLANSAGSMKVSGEWNELLPDYKFTSVEDFLVAAWQGKE